MARSLRTHKHVALAFPLAVPHLALFMKGVTDYARRHGGWTFSASPVMTGGFPETLAMAMPSLKGWHGDGVIAVITNPSQARGARALGIPVVNLAGSRPDLGLPQVMVDHKAIGRMAADHLLDCGLRRFVYLGLNDVWYSQLRRDGFVERVTEAGAKGAVMGLSGGMDSSVGAVLCQRAFPETTLGIIMPCYSPKEDIEHAQALAQRFSIHRNRRPRRHF